MQASASQSTRYLLWLILSLALLLRVGYALSLDPLSVYREGGGDSAWYLANGYGLFTGQEHGWVRDVTFYVSTIPTAPLYLIFVGLPQTVLSDALAIYVIRLAQALASTASCYFAYGISWRISGDARGGLLAALVGALYPPFIMEAGALTTETLYIFFVAAGVWLYIEGVILARGGRGAMVLGVALALGLATLTRAVALLFPLGIAVHLLWVGRRAWWRYAVGLLVVYSAVVGIWTLYNWGVWGRLVIGSDQMMPTIWRGATNINDREAIDRQFLGESHRPGEEGDDCVDCKLRIPNSAFAQATLETIANDPIAYARLRVTALLGAYLEPHGVAQLSGESLRALALAWLREDFTLSGLGRLLGADNFWPKLFIYAIHWSGILLGVVGMWLYRAQWRTMLAPGGFIAYTTLIHLALLVIPRYIFPTDIFFWALGSGVLWRWYDRWRRPRSQDATIPSETNRTRLR